MLCNSARFEDKRERKHGLLFHCVCHELLLCTFWADDVLPIRNEALPNHAGLAGATDEAVVMPVATLEGNESGSSNTSDGFAASCASFREQFTEAVSTIGFVVSRGESLSGKRLLAVCTSEALPMPGIIAISDSTLGDHLAAFDTFGGKFLLVALSTVDVVLFRDEALGADGVLAGAAHETFLVPLPRFVLHFFHASLEYIATSVTSSGELCIIAGSTVDPVSLRAKLFVHKTGPTLIAEKASLMPVFLLV